MFSPIRRATGAGFAMMHPGHASIRSGAYLRNIDDHAPRVRADPFRSSCRDSIGGSPCLRFSAAPNFVPSLVIVTAYSLLWEWKAKFVPSRWGLDPIAKYLGPRRCALWLAMVMRLGTSCVSASGSLCSEGNMSTCALRWSRTPAELGFTVTSIFWCTAQFSRPMLDADIPLWARGFGSLLLRNKCHTLEYLARRIWRCPLEVLIRPKVGAASYCKLWTPRAIELCTVHCSHRVGWSIYDPR
ncbi:hypothetical protein DFH09DRAFT_1279120 [Mycena vulgaris]|nr:hypothetical protein DFH09DRAFT_1279120 [Mycena vulgaris]